MGDAVYEQLVRERLLLSANRPVGQLHQLAIKKVCAAFQANAIENILPELTEEEQTVVRRGRNATGTTVPKHSSALEYRHATSLESLFGYLHLKGETERINYLFDIIWETKAE